MSRFAPQHGHRDIAILDKPAAMQPAVAATAEHTAHTIGLVHAFQFLPIARRFAKQAEGFSHLRFSGIGRTRIA